MRSVKILCIFFITLFLIDISRGYEDFVQYEKGYYYITVKKGSFKSVNAKLIEEIRNHGWDIIHTINVDKTADLSFPYKTHLLCKRGYLKKGVKLFKPIGVIIPCKMAIFVEGNKIKVLVEDVTELGKSYAPNDKNFKKFLLKVKDEMVDILNRTANKFSKSRYTPYE